MVRTVTGGFLQDQKGSGQRSVLDLLVKSLQHVKTSGIRCREGEENTTAFLVVWAWGSWSKDEKRKFGLVGPPAAEKLEGKAISPTCCVMLCYDVFLLFGLQPGSSQGSRGGR